MLEITVHRADGGLASFQFENDALQAFLTENPNADTVFTVTELRALGSTPVTARGGVPAGSRTHNADGTPKTTGAGDYRTPRDTLGIRTPIQETARAKAQTAAEFAQAQSQARSDAADRAAAEAKAKSEKK